MTTPQVLGATPYEDDNASAHPIHHPNSKSYRDSHSDTAYTSSPSSHPPPPPSASVSADGDQMMADDNEFEGDARAWDSLNIGSFAPTASMRCEVDDHRAAGLGRCEGREDERERERTGRRRQPSRRTPASSDLHVVFSTETTDDRMRTSYSSMGKQAYEEAKGASARLPADLRLRLRIRGSDEGMDLEADE
ncbi:hypothetical protein C8F01DRAFT_1370214 [Mycena amicta]|nr:hypothetical protein C8F01DRAFT_1370214 [Mycena amicta]